MTDAITTSPLAAALAALEVDEPARPLTASHETAWRAGDWKIKTAPAGTPPAIRLEHEAHVVRLLHTAGLYPVDSAHGRHGNHVWTAIGRLPGRTLWQEYASAREAPLPPDGAQRMLDIALDAFTTLRRLHTAGWRHGDIQPFNMIVGATGNVAFIDWDRAHHPDLLTLPYPYRGGMDHGTAPEIARALADTPPETAVVLTEDAETYGLGAAIRWAFTGETPSTTLRVGPDVSPDVLLDDIATSRHRPTLRNERPWPHPELEALIENATHPDPRHRVGPTPATDRPRTTRPPVDPTPSPREGVSERTGPGTPGAVDGPCARPPASRGRSSRPCNGRKHVDDVGPTSHK
ncbi:serine/threonine-protein kinase [Embleya scabrispora]|uniref:serine/threonine-protein kinase n=1 Tax=Embleya scabrispora TaxID=159449 RepID=UPI000367CEFF|nr:serine/threonine-protein kinase [Embleya scabrispora]